MSEPILIKPKHLKKGDTIAICAPASPPFNPGDLEYSIEWLSKLGLKIKLGENLLKSYSDLAGTDEERLEDFHRFVADKDVSAIIPVRGGNGVPRLLPKIDFELIRKNPKIIIGFSDLTGLINPIHQRTGLVTFHGPMAASFYRSSYCHFYFQKALMSNKPLGLIVDPIPSELWAPKYPPPRLVIAEGKARGPLAGGCMTLIKQLMGTPYELETEGKILFLEDVGEEPHSIDRYLTQLLLSGALHKAKGIVIGECSGCEPGGSGRIRLPLNKSVEHVLRERLSGLGIPVIYGLRLGHGDDQFTIPIGINASIEAGKGKVKFKIEEAATI
ncbi:MAG: LD-carboxypeptidase [Candidatus Obscuribacterales bacterium]|nr:LD-carboxypeptidase [Candidatus Obscuribacterales bacterium]